MCYLVKIGMTFYVVSHETEKHIAMLYQAGCMRNVMIWCCPTSSDWKARVFGGLGCDDCLSGTDMQ